VSATIFLLAEADDEKSHTPGEDHPLRRNTVAPAQGLVFIHQNLILSARTRAVSPDECNLKAVALKPSVCRNRGREKDA
jgi:hypothetical protein